MIDVNYHDLSAYDMKVFRECNNKLHVVDVIV